MTSMTSTVIAYWMDRTEADRPWIVSLEDGTSSKTLRVLQTEDEAREAAEAIAAERGLTVEAK